MAIWQEGTDMKWIDYRDALGIGFSDEKKEMAFSNRIIVLIDMMEMKYEDYHHARELICTTFFIEVSDAPRNHYTWYEVKESIAKEKSFKGVLSKSVALANAIKKSTDSEEAWDYLKKALNDLNISYELMDDSDGSFVFPKGAKELDEGLVNAPYEWLRDYPASRKAMTRALKAYSNGINHSEVADLFRKALETFVQEFFNSSKSLENLRSEIGQFFKGRDVPKDLSNNFETTIQMYTNYNNSYAKHHDRTSGKLLEFLMYQTGNIIRLIITISKN